MSESTCSGCQERDAIIAVRALRVAHLEAKVHELQARLGQNSSNSSTPPSANPLHAPTPTPKKPSGRNRGGHPGHKGHRRQRLPASVVRHTIALIPNGCEACRTPLPQQPQPQDPDPTWHQVAELPRLAAGVTEFQGHARTCPCCHHVTRASIPQEITAHRFGPRFQATLSYLAGCPHVSKRGLEEIGENIFGVPVSLGPISFLDQQTNQALEKPYQEILEAVQQAPVKNVDETSWEKAGQKRGLWVAVTSVAIFFAVKLRRRADSLRALLGEPPLGVIGSDRFSAYSFLAEEQRQAWWAHLKRDFQAMVDAGGEGAKIGAELLLVEQAVFECWHQVREGKRTRPWLAAEVKERLDPWIGGVLLRGRESGCAKTAGTCVKLLEMGQALWTFTRAEGVEPTNNTAERALRGAVIWRKKSFGSQSEAGCEFVGRRLSVGQTVRLQGGRVLEYLTQAINAHRHDLPVSSVLSAH